MLDTEQHFAIGYELEIRLELLPNLKIKKRGGQRSRSDFIF